MSVLAPSNKFELLGPSHQNAVDIFKGRWASDFAEACPGVTAGDCPHFTVDTRPADAARLLGTNDRLDGMRVLELGPLEGGHTYQLEKLGAESIIAIEGNAEAFLKCLVTKEMTGLRAARFFHGDFTKYIASTDDRFDLVFCSGVLYHMKDPISVIMSIAKLCDRCFVWTHYYDEERYTGPPRRVRHDPRYPGMKLYVQKLSRDDMEMGKFWGGNQPVTVWLSKEDILSSFRRAGLSEIEIVEEDLDAPIGPSFSFAARRP